MTTAQTCYLKNLEGDIKITLPDNEEIFLGRDPITQIKNTAVSKKQISCTADYASYEVTVKWLGTNMSGINGFALKKGSIYKLTHDDRIEMLLRKFIFEIVFEPPPPKVFEDNVRPKNETKISNDSKNVESKTQRETKVKNATIFEMASGSKAKQACVDYKWERLYDGKLHVMFTRDVRPSSKIASYDLDGTIITTKSGLVFPKDITDWKFLYSDMPQKLKKLHENGFQVVIFTNQAGIGIGKLLLSDFKLKLENIARKLNVPIKAYISTGKGLYRKPMTGMWDEFLKSNDNISIDKDESFYCGDAAGRPANWAPKTKKDHSISDRLFARNIGLKFFTPEEHFLKQKPASFSEPSFNPKQNWNKPLTEPQTEQLVAVKQELLILVGLPASGKSFICQEYLIPAEYRWINRDTLSTAARCLSMTEEALLAKEKVVVDNTNVDKKSREPYIQLARKYNVPVRCGIMTTTVQHCLHNIIFREFTDTSHNLVSIQVMNTLKSKYEEPSTDEGFNSIFKINFIPKFSDDKSKQLYEIYLLDK